MAAATGAASHAAVAVTTTVDGTPGRRERSQAGDKAIVHQGRSTALDQFVREIDRLLDTGKHRLSWRRRPATGGCFATCTEACLQCQRDEPLLDGIVQVLLERAPSSVLRGQQSPLQGSDVRGGAIGLDASSFPQHGEVASDLGDLRRRCIDWP